MQQFGYNKCILIAGVDGARRKDCTMNDIDEATRKGFRNWVFTVLCDNYKEGLLAEQRTRWALTKSWNSRPAHVGIPGEVRKALGEEAATRLFQDEADSFRFNPEGISWIKEVRASRQQSKNTEDMFNQR